MHVRSNSITKRRVFSWLQRLSAVRFIYANVYVPLINANKIDVYNINHVRVLEMRNGAQFSPLFFIQSSYDYVSARWICWLWSSIPLQVVLLSSLLLVAKFEAEASGTSRILLRHMGQSTLRTIVNGEEWNRHLKEAWRIQIISYCLVWLLLFVFTFLRSNKDANLGCQRLFKLFKRFMYTKQIIPNTGMKTKKNYLKSYYY